MHNHISARVALSVAVTLGATMGAALPVTSLATTPAPSRTQSAPVHNDTLSRRDWQQIRALLAPAPVPAQQAYLKASNAAVLDLFGWSVAISGNTVVVGALLQGLDASGGAYVFTRTGSTWSQQAFLKASNTGPDDDFGSSVAISGDTLVVGARLEDSSATGVNSGLPDDNLAHDAGSAYVFVRSAGTWSQQAYLKASNTDANDHFGTSVAVSGDTIVVGAESEDGASADPNADSGAAYVFTRTGTDWNEQAYLQPSPMSTALHDEFGLAVALSSDTIVVGALFRDGSIDGAPGDDAPVDSGAAFVFTRSGTSWNQQAQLRASNLGGGDLFGGSVAVDADTIVVGAVQEDSSTTGVGSIPNEAAPDSGAAYVFKRTGSLWDQQEYLKASNTGQNDWFGTSVAVSGDTAVVGAYQESSNLTGVNGGPDNNSASHAGAAYVFTRSGTSWSQLAHVKASNTQAGDDFGVSAGLSGDTLVVGAYYESSATGNDQSDNSAAAAGAAYVFRVPDACQPGYYSTTGDDTNGPCTAASAGHFVDIAGATGQAACVLGFFQPNSAQTACLPADIGYYVDTTGATAEIACPAGETTTATASDSASDCSTPTSPPPSSPTPYQVKQNASAHLKALIPTGWAPSDTLLNKAIFRIDKSLTAWRWIDQNTLNPLHGYRVFNSERKTVRFLTSPLFYGNATVTTAISDLVSADRAIVVHAISSSSDPAAIATANTKLALADSRIAAGQYGPAIRALKQAWLALA